MSDTNPTPQLRRGNHTLGHQSQMLRRDLAAETINRHLSASALGYTRTDAQLAQCREITVPEPDPAYRYLIFAPDRTYLAWIAFHTDTELHDWLAAYQLERVGTIMPGATFQVNLPTEPVGQYAVVATDHCEVHAGPFDTPDDATAAMHQAFPATEPWDGRDVPVAVAELPVYTRMWADELQPAGR